MANINVVIRVASDGGILCEVVASNDEIITGFFLVSSYSHTAYIAAYILSIFPVHCMRSGSIL